MMPRHFADGPLFDRVELERLDGLRAERDRLTRLDARWRLRPRSNRCRALQTRLEQLTREILETEQAVRREQEAGS
jgi:hypothetical protein